VRQASREGADVQLVELDELEEIVELRLAAVEGVADGVADRFVKLEKAERYQVKNLFS
jgi:hypothetical protein